MLYNILAARNLIIKGVLIMENINIDIRTDKKMEYKNKNKKTSSDRNVKKALLEYKKHMLKQLKNDEKSIKIQSYR
jgi:hypothetical protein